MQIKAFFNTMEWWGICPTGPLPLPHHLRKKMAYCPKARALGLCIGLIEFVLKTKKTALMLETS
jgi:hypothetical protein